MPVYKLHLTPGLNMYGRLLDGDDRYDQGFHGTPLIIAWLPAANFAVLIAAMRWHKYSFYAHVALALLIIILTLVGTLHLLIDDWINQNSYDDWQHIHNISGLIVVIWLGAEVITGILARVIQYSPKVSTNVSIYTKRVHYVSSYGIMLLAKFAYINIDWTYGQVQGGFVVLIIIDLLYLAFYLWIKFGYWTLSEEIIESQMIFKERETKENIIKEYIYTAKDTAVALKDQIKRDQFPVPKYKDMETHYESEKEIDLQKYVLFNDYVYDIKKFQQYHPGGEYVMSIMNKREIDRFMYGNYAAELTPNVRVQDHTKDSFRLVGPPVAKMDRLCPMKGIKKAIKTKMTMCHRLSNKSDSYIIHIVPHEEENNLRFQGFEHEKQIGQYFSLTIGNHKGRKRTTRLYTTIWSMRPKNIKFMAQNFPDSTKFKHNEEFKQLEMTQNIAESQSNLHSASQVIPFVIKKYKKGALTPKLLIDDYKGQLVLSAPMGAGMHYGEIPTSGKVVLVCGGTGILPFCDFIDLLFKRVKYLEGSHIGSDLARNDSLIKDDLIKQRDFIIYCAAECALDLPPLTVYQIDFLTGSTKIKFSNLFRIKKDANLISRQFSKINLTDKYFNDSVIGHLKEDVAKFYLCGSPAMNASIGLQLIKNKVKQQDYHFM